MALKKLETADLKTEETKATVEAASVKEPEPAKEEPVDEGRGELVDDAPAGEDNVEGEGQDDAQVTDTKVDPDELAEDAVVTPVKETAEPEPATQQVALNPNNTAALTVTEQKHSAMQTFTSDAAEQGFEGLTLTGMSFDRLKLNDKEFQLGIDEVSLGTVVQFKLLTSRNVFIIRQFDGKGAEMFYSYDKEGKTNTDGTSAQEILDQWAEDGYGGDLAGGNKPLSIKTYIEATVQLVNLTGEYAKFNDEVVMASIPPASTAKLGGAVAVGQMKFAKQLGRKPLIGEMLYEAKVGPKVGSGEEAFYPWVFKAISVLED